MTMNTIAPTGTLDIYAVGELHPRFAAQLTRGALTVDLAQLEGIDGAGVQLLLWAQAEAGRAGVPFALEHVTPATREVFDFLRVFPERAP